MSTGIERTAGLIEIKFDVWEMVFKKNSKYVLFFFKFHIPN